MQARYGWALVIAVIAVIVVWDVVAAITEGETVTGTFRCSVAQTNWRWPVLVLAVLVLVHLFLPARLWRYDPLDRLYYRLNGTPTSSIPPGCSRDHT
jgi:hypothetical protein